MSSFQGFIKEVPGIAVDRFENTCLQSRYLFLSHCHSDHMVGLSTKLELTVPLFASEISVVFLRKEFPNLYNMIKPLSINSPLHLKYTFEGEEHSVEVTALPAKHCPGSVMFLFETKEHTVLYTGDFRLIKRDFENYDILRTRQIASVYLDSTFLMEKFYEFPTREESLYQICNLIKDWLDRQSENTVIIEMPAQYGIEFLFVGIQRKLKERIYVRSSQWEKYIYFPSLDKCLEPKQEKCRITAKLKEGHNKTNHILPKNVRVIKPSAMYWENWRRSQPFVEQIKETNEYRVAYSSHCSYSELKDFLDFIQPDAVRLNVVPKKSEEMWTRTLLKIYNPVKKEADYCTDFEACSFNEAFIPGPNSKEKLSPDVVRLPKRLKM